MTGVLPATRSLLPKKAVSSGYRFRTRGIRMRAEQSDVPTETQAPVVDPTAETEAREVDPATGPQLVRRATQLCLRAEPHTDESPCAVHLAEAQRQLLGLTG